MKTTLSLLLTLICFGSLAFAAQRSVEELRAQIASASPQDQPKIYKPLIEQETGTLEDLYRTGDTDKASALVEQLAKDCEAAAHASKTTRKHMKSTEITLRKAGERLDNLQRNAAFDDRPPITAALDRIEQARSSLLEAMFAK